MSEIEVFEQMNDEMEDLKKERDALRIGFNEAKDEVKRLAEQVCRLKGDNDALRAELDAMKLKYDELHDQRFKEARESDSIKAQLDAAIKVNTFNVRGLI